MHEDGNFVLSEIAQRFLVAVAFEFVESRVVGNRQPARGQKDGNVVGAFFHSSKNPKNESTYTATQNRMMHVIPY